MDRGSKSVTVWQTVFTRGEWQKWYLFACKMYYDILWCALILREFVSLAH